MRFTSAASRRRGSRHDDRVTHRAARLPLYRAGGGAVDNATPQGSTYPPENSVQMNGASSKHGLDFKDARQVIESERTVTFEDRRYDYGE